MHQKEIGNFRAYGDALEKHVLLVFQYNIVKRQQINCAKFFARLKDGFFCAEYIALLACPARRHAISFATELETMASL